MQVLDRVRTAPPVNQPVKVTLIHSVPPPAKRTRSNFLLLSAFCGFLFFYGLNAGEFWRTESLRALVAADFLRTGNWCVPRLYGEPLLTKPPGMYAAIALASWPLGRVSEWSARLPSALAATATVLLIYWHFRRYLGPFGGLVAAVVTPTSFMWLDKSSVAEIDMLQVAWVTTAILCFLRALECVETRGQRSRARDKKGRFLPALSHLTPDYSLSEWFWWLGALFCVAGGVLTKWTAPAFFYLTVVSLLWWRGRLHLLLGRKHLVSAALAASLCFFWAGMTIAQVGWDAFYSTLSREAVARFYPSKYGDPYPWLEVPGYPFYILATNLPWSAGALLALNPSFARLWDSRSRMLLQALHCWFWPNLAFWSLIAEHAPRHSFPIFPGIAGLAAFVWIAWFKGLLRWPFSRVLPRQALVGMVVIWLGVKVAFVHVVVPARNANRQPRAKGEQLAAVVPPGETLYVFHLKDRDEGIMFYYGRPVRRVAGPQSLPASDQPLYCLLEESEWQEWRWPGTAKLAFEIRGELGQPLFLIRVGDELLTRAQPNEVAVKRALPRQVGERVGSGPVDVSTPIVLAPRSLGRDHDPCPGAVCENGPQSTPTPGVFHDY
jgi:4-amino-4-deoxy-L-arabinose transferase-like glycosyltransferase